MGGAGLRVGTWNLNFRGPRPRITELQGEFAASHVLDLVMLQEVNPRLLRSFAESGGFDWAISAADLRIRPPGEGPGRRRASAVVGRGAAPTAAKLFTDVRLPERVIVSELDTRVGPVTAVSYHAPPGVSWGRVKVDHAVTVASWLATIDGTVIVGANANTPEVDHPDRERVRTHWYTGMPKLEPGEPGDDIMFGGEPVHGLEDALRRWLDDHPAELAAIRAERPDGPLAVSHRTGKRKEWAGHPRRFDALWVSSDLRVDAITYDYDGAIAAGSDHALVVAELHRDGTDSGGSR